MESGNSWASRTVLLCGAAGMALGLWLDARAGGVATLASLCLSGQRDLAGILALHWEQLPRMHLGMVAGTLAAAPALQWLGYRHRIGATIARNLACSAWMIVGMAAGTLAFTRLAGWTASHGGPLAMLAAMVGGMVAGSVVDRLATRIPTRRLAA